jgi:hypothetical protein
MLTLAAAAAIVDGMTPIAMESATTVVATNAVVRVLKPLS